MKTTMMAVAVVAVLGGGVVLAKGGGALDGKSFAVDTAEKGKPAGKEAETLVFKDGKFRSTGCDPYGFAEAPYTAKAAGGATSWEADTTSAKEGKIHWKGTVKGDSVEGSYVWTKTGQAPIEYWFKSKK